MHKSKMHAITKTERMFTILQSVLYHQKFFCKSHLIHVFGDETMVFLVMGCIVSLAVDMYIYDFFKEISMLTHNERCIMILVCRVFFGRMTFPSETSHGDHIKRAVIMVFYHEYQCLLDGLHKHQQNNRQEINLTQKEQNHLTNHIKTKFVSPKNFFSQASDFVFW